MQVNIVNDRDSGSVYEEMSLFLRANDEDGFEDLETIYLIHDESELYWSISSAEWEERAKGSETWIGTNGISTADLASLPRGTYRLQLLDLAGDRDEYELALQGNAPDISAVVFPELYISENRMTINSPYTKHNLWFYSSTGRFLYSFEASEKELLIDDFPQNIQNTSGTQLYVYSFDQKRELGLISGPYEFY